MGNSPASTDHAGLSSIFFGRLAKVSVGWHPPYPVFAYAALLPWQLFSYSMTEASNSLIGSQNLITKIYFPRLVIPIAAVLGGLVDFAISFVVLLILMLVYGITPTLAILTIPLFILLVVATAPAVGLWLSALNVRYRDVRYTIPFLAQFWLFLTPVAYPSSIVPEKWRVVFGLNPMAGVVEGFRWALLGKREALGAMPAVSILIVAVFLISGLSTSAASKRLSQTPYERRRDSPQRSRKGLPHRRRGERRRSPHPLRQSARFARRPGVRRNLPARAPPSGSEEFFWALKKT